MPTSTESLKSPFMTPQMGESAPYAGSNPDEAAVRTAEPAESLAGKVKGAAFYVGEKVEKATEAVGHGLEAAGKSLGEHVPEQGILGSAGHAVGSYMENTGHYLETHGVTGIAKDITSCIRQYPVSTLLVGLGIGFLAARLMRR